MKVDREFQKEMKERAKIARNTPFWTLDKDHGTYDPEGKLKKAWIKTHLERVERNKRP